MKKIFILFFIISISLITNAQRKMDFGVLGGTNFYLGDINQENPFYSPGYNFGVIARYNVDKRTSVRFKAVYASITGSDNDFDNVIVGRLPNTFSANLLNTGLQAEYNFFDYKTGDIAYNWTPYIAAGLGYSVALSSSSTAGLSAKSHFNIPFGLGAKVNLGRRLSAGAEWTFTKTFSDRVDGIVPPTGETILYKNDWYNFFGLFITYKFVKFAVDCPAFN